VLLTTTHLIVGALMLASALAVALRAYRYSAPVRAAARNNVLKEQYSV
jgi:hypothetical protein